MRKSDCFTMIESRRWDGKDKNDNLVVSGVYLYQLRAGSFFKQREIFFRALRQALANA
jgi:hypothetical protein